MHLGLFFFFFHSCKSYPFLRKLDLVTYRNVLFYPLMILFFSVTPRTSFIQTLWSHVAMVCLVRQLGKAEGKLELLMCIRMRLFSLL